MGFCPALTCRWSACANRNMLSTPTASTRKGMTCREGARQAERQGKGKGSKGLEGEQGDNGGVFQSYVARK